MSGISVKIPLSLSEQDGPYKLNKRLSDTVKQNLKMLLMTIPGERVMDPNFGVGIQRYLFENDTIELRSRIGDRIKKQVSEYMPFLKVRETILPSINDLTSSADNHMITISVRYFIEAVSEEDILNINISPFDSSQTVF
jgi:phage baseplate assembly protein W